MGMDKNKVFRFFSQAPWLLVHPVESQERLGAHSGTYGDLSFKPVFKRTFKARSFSRAVTMQAVQQTGRQSVRGVGLLIRIGKTPRVREKEADG